MQFRRYLDFNKLEKRSGVPYVSLKRPVERTAKMLGISVSSVYKAERKFVGGKAKSEVSASSKQLGRRKMDSFDSGVSILLWGKVQVDGEKIA